MSRTDPSSIFVCAALVAAFLILPGQALAQEQATAAPRTRSLQLLEALGVRDRTGPALNQQLEVFRKAHPGVPHDFWRAQYDKHLQARRLSNALAEVLEKRFNAEEIEALLDFYSSSVGKRVVLLRVELGQEARKLGRSLGEQFQREVRRDMKAQGYLQ